MSELEFDSYLDLKKEGYNHDIVDPSAGAALFEESLDLVGSIEAILFASPKPMRSGDVYEVLKKADVDCGPEQVEQALKSLQKAYREKGGGFSLVYLKRIGYQFQTAKAASFLMEHLFASRPRPLSRAALETLSVVAYRQPVTRADIEFIRGVDSGSILKNLLERDLVACVGRKEDSGRPMLFGTTLDFLSVFNLESLDALPPLAAFQPSADLVREVNAKMNSNNSDEIPQIVKGDEEGNLDALAELSRLEGEEKTAVDLETSGPIHESVIEGAVAEGGSFDAGGLFPETEVKEDADASGDAGEAAKIFGREGPSLPKAD